MTQPSYWAVVPAAGVGKRMGTDIPKQYLAIAGKPVLQHTLERLLAFPLFKSVVVALSPKDPFWPELPVAANPRITVVPGGKERGDSVLAGLFGLDGIAADGDWVLVHDAARPCLQESDLHKLTETLGQDAVGGILALPCHDTLKKIEGDKILETLDRNVIWRALTPQMFRYRLLRDALSRALERGIEITDEASAIESAGYHPKIVEGRPDNIKITRPEDLSLAEFFLEHQ